MNNQDELVKDLTCGMVKPKSQMKASAVFKRHTYYFCSESDKEMFLANPDRWIQKDPKKAEKEII